MGTPATTTTNSTNAVASVPVANRPRRSGIRATLTQTPATKIQPTQASTPAAPRKKPAKRPSRKRSASAARSSPAALPPKEEQVEFVLTDSYSPLEMRDAIKIISDRSPLHALVMDVIASDPSVYTMRGRLNKSRLCEILKIKPKELNRVLNDARILLGTPIDGPP